MFVCYCYCCLSCDMCPRTAVPPFPLALYKNANGVWSYLSQEATIMVAVAVVVVVIGLLLVCYRFVVQKIHSHNILATLLWVHILLFNSAKFPPGTWPTACKEIISSQNYSCHRCQNSDSNMLCCSDALPVHFSKQRLPKKFINT